MAYGQFNYYSLALGRDVPFTIYVPNDVNPDIRKTNAKYYQNPTRLLLLLNGFSGDSNSWNNQGLIRELSETHNLMIVCPAGENSFYIDQRKTGGKFATFVGEELVNYVSKTFNITCNRDATLIAGMSMGGYGALHVGLQYPETFGHIIALSPAMVYYAWENKTIDESYDDGIANYYYYSETFGPLKDALKSNINVLVQLQNLREKQVDLPSIYIACGTEDPLVYEWDQGFVNDLKQAKINYTFEQGPGVHNFKFWNKFLIQGIDENTP